MSGRIEGFTYIRDGLPVAVPDKYTARNLNVLARPRMAAGLANLDITQAGVIGKPLACEVPVKLTEPVNLVPSFEPTVTAPVSHQGFGRVDNVARRMRDGERYFTLPRVQGLEEEIVQNPHLLTTAVVDAALVLSELYDSTALETTEAQGGLLSRAVRLGKRIRVEWGETGKKGERLESRIKAAKDLMHIAEDAKRNLRTSGTVFDASILSAVNSGDR